MSSIAIDRIDGLSSETSVKGPCRVATTGNVALTGLQTIDSVSLSSGDRVLVKDQTDASENGIYVVDTGPWRRSKDFNKTRDVAAGTTIIVWEGTINQRTAYSVSSTTNYIGTSDISFRQVFANAERALTSYTSISSAPIVQTVYFNGGIFSWSAGNKASLVAADTYGGVFVASSLFPSSTGCWVRNEAVSEQWKAEWFGVRGDDSTASGARINSAINVMLLYRGRVSILLPPGIIRHEVPILINDDNISLYGSGREATVLRRTYSNGDGILVRHGTAGTLLTDSGIYDLSMDETVEMGEFYSVVRVENAMRFNAEGVASINGFYGLSLLGVFDADIDGFNQRFDYYDQLVDFPSGKGRVGLLVGLASDDYGNTLGANIKIVNSEFKTAHGAGGVAYGANYGAFVDAVDGMWISNTYFGYCLQAAFRINNRLAQVDYPNARIVGVQVSTCWLDHNRGDGLIVDGSGLSISGVHTFTNVSFLGGANSAFNIRIEGNASTIKVHSSWVRLVKGDCFYFNSTGSGFIISANHIGEADTDGAAGGSSIAIADGSDFVITGNVIDGVDYSDAGIFIASGTNFIVSDNIVKNCTVGVLVGGDADYYYITDSNLLHECATPYFSNSTGTHLHAPTPL